MAQPPPDQNFYHQHPHAHTHHPQLQLPPQFRNPFDLIFDERTGAINYNYIRPYIPNRIPKPDHLSDSLVIRRPRRTRTTFTRAQIAELEQHFLQGRYLTSPRLAELSAKLALGTAQVKIWFKNRRRRHKIQSDQQKEFSCDGMPLSPPVPNSSKSEPNGSGSSCGSNSSGSSSSGKPLSLQSLSLNGSGVSTPNALTPSPTPTTPPAILIEQYGEPGFNPYYYNNHHASHPPHHQNQAHPVHASLTHPYVAADTQYYPPPPPPLPPPPNTLQHHQHQQQYHAPHPHQFQIQHKPEATSIKKDLGYNFNNPYYMRMTTSLADNSATSAVHAPTAMSPNCEVYESLTPKNDENSTLSNDVGSINIDPVNDSNKTKTKMLVTNNVSGKGDTFNSKNSISSESFGTPARNIVDNCTGPFGKFPKMSSDTNDSNYQCTVDTLMHAYNNHRNSSTNAQQFATYCFN